MKIIFTSEQSRSLSILLLKDYLPDELICMIIDYIDIDNIEYRKKQMNYNLQLIKYHPEYINTSYSFNTNIIYNNFTNKINIISTFLTDYYLNKYLDTIKYKDIYISELKFIYMIKDIDNINKYMRINLRSQINKLFHVFSDEKQYYKLCDIKTLLCSRLNSLYGINNNYIIHNFRYKDYEFRIIMSLHDRIRDFKGNHVYKIEKILNKIKV